jgi:hypothetical protein
MMIAIGREERNGRKRKEEGNLRKGFCTWKLQVGKKWSLESRTLASPQWYIHGTSTRQPKIFSILNVGSADVM